MKINKKNHTLQALIRVGTAIQFWKILQNQSRYLWLLKYERLHGSLGRDDTAFSITKFSKAKIRIYCALLVFYAKFSKAKK